jgi:hypothetical protein
LALAAQQRYGEDGRGVAAGNEFVLVGIVVSGSGAVAVVEDGELDVLSDGVLVRVAEAVGGAACVVVSGVVVDVPGVSLCWPQPHSNTAASALAAAIWIFCIDFIFIIPFSWWNRK